MQSAQSEGGERSCGRHRGIDVPRLRRSLGRRHGRRLRRRDSRGCRARRSARRRRRRDLLRCGPGRRCRRVARGGRGGLDGARGARRRDRLHRRGWRDRPRVRRGHRRRRLRDRSGFGVPARSHGNRRDGHHGGADREHDREATIPGPSRRRTRGDRLGLRLERRRRRGFSERRPSGRVRRRRAHDLRIVGGGRLRSPECGSELVTHRQRRPIAVFAGLLPTSLAMSRRSTFTATVFSSASCRAR